MAKRGSTEQVKAQRILAVGFDDTAEFFQIDEVPHRLAHLASAAGPPAVGEDFFRKRLSKRHEHRWPVDRVKPENFFPDQVQIGRPIAAETRIAVGAKSQ